MTHATRQPSPAESSRGPERKPLSVLGVNFSGSDPNAAIVIDGQIIAAVEEERFVREKHAAGRFPTHAIHYCLARARRMSRPVDLVAFGWNCTKYSNGDMQRFYEGEVNSKFNVDDATRRWQRWMLHTYSAEEITRRIHEALLADGTDREALPPVRFLDHHRTHAAGAYLLSGFDAAAILTLDGSGEETCTAIWSGQSGEVKQHQQFAIPHSLGWYYAAMTEYLGFRAYDGEYMVMGLAPYGNHSPALAQKLRRVVGGELPAGDYRIDPSYIHYGPHTHSGRYTDALPELLGSPPRRRDTDPTDHYKDVAHATQSVLEAIGVGLAKRATEMAGSPRLCLAGGTALNCKMNQRILESAWVDDVFVLPNAGDGGQSLSAALLLDADLTGRRPSPLRSVALGPEFSDGEIKAFLDECLIEADHVEDVASLAAQDVADGKIVGWFQGRMEFGPRALGNRSILADPRATASRDRVNAVVKYREYWRPFCPSILYEAARDYFSIVPSDAPFMTITLPVRPEMRGKIGAVVHVDGSARPQFVHRQTHSLYHRAIEEFARITGVPSVLNTSFNVKGEPIVCTPRDAVRNFYSCGMDVLYLGSFRLQKGKPRHG